VHDVFAGSATRFPTCLREALEDIDRNRAGN